ncbi:MAG: EamA family transporter [Frankiaceae bacterium]
MSVLLALLASLLWGTSDFLGGTLSRRMASFDVVAGSQAIALVVLTVLALGPLDAHVTLACVLWSIAAGVVGLLALGAFYRGLAEGTMGVVAPIAATGVAVPVIVGVIGGDHLSPLQVVGIVVAVLGVVAAGGPDVRAARAGGLRHRPVLLAVVAALGFGAVLLFIAKGSESSVLVTLLVMRLSAVVCLGTVALALRRRPTIARPDLPVLAGVGMLDLAANAAYGIATRSALVSLAAVLASLYPVVTVVLARQIHAERLSRSQLIGAVAAICGGALIAFTGSGA